MRETYYYDSRFQFSPALIAIWCVLALIQIVSMWRIFQKAGKPGWASIIPIYNLYVMVKIVGKRGWWMLWFLVPIANIVVAIMLLYYLVKSFGRDGAFTLGLLF